jgi:prepilin-type processing-associated H-X9-DG protein
MAQMWTGQAALATSVLLPALNRAREQGNRVKSASNLRQIGLAAQMHANENKGKLPNDIADLLKQDLSPEVFVNPRTNNSGPPPGLEGAAAAKWVQENSDYVYTGAGLDFRAPDDTILGYEKPDALRDGLNILFVDGHVEFFPMAQAMQKIKAAGGAGGARGGNGTNRPAPAPPGAPRPAGQPPKSF